MRGHAPLMVVHHTSFWSLLFNKLHTGTCWLCYVSTQHLVCRVAADNATCDGPPILLEAQSVLFWSLTKPVVTVCVVMSCAAIGVGCAHTQGCMCSMYGVCARVGVVAPAGDWQKGGETSVLSGVCWEIAVSAIKGHTQT